MPGAKQLDKLSKGELYELAQEHDVSGRSQMDRTELIDAVREASGKGDGAAAEDGGRSRPGGRSKRAGTRDGRKTQGDGDRPRRRALWKGAITFGLITIPVGLHPAVEERDIHFHMLDRRDGSRIRYKRVSAASGREVERDDIVKGYEFEKDRYVTFTDEELARIPSESFRTIDVVQFVDAVQIDPVHFQRAYYVAPEPSGTKAYALLTEALEKSGRVGLAKITLRDKERLAVLRARDGVMMLETMNWPDEIREPPFSPDDPEHRPTTSPREVEMARRLIDELTEDFDPARFRDSYRERLEQAIRSKIEGEEISLAPEEAAQAEEVGDLMEALRASVEAARSRSSSSGPDGRAKTG
jgi:DNA end-binding protein Ku